MVGVGLMNSKKENPRTQYAHSTSTIHHFASNIHLGFSLVELLVVIAVIGVLISLPKHPISE